MRYPDYRRKYKKKKVRAIILGGKNPKECNSIDNPENIVPRESVLNIEGGNFSFEMTKWSFAVLRIKTT